MMAMSLILLLMTISLELHLNQRANLTNAAVFRDRQTLDQMTRSGIQLGMAILIKDRLDSEVDSIQEDWADADALASYIEQIPFENGTLEISIVDELSKIQVNALIRFPQVNQINVDQRNIWQRFAAGLLSYLDEEQMEDPPEMEAIINSIIDWIDSGDDDATTGLSGAESDYYESLDPPYACKNGPFDHLSELRLVKGITPELFNGIGGEVGLGAYLTVFGAEKTEDQKFSFPGKVNINTAELPVLAAILPLESAEFAPMLIEYRESKTGTQFNNDLTQPNWYKNVPGLAEVDLNENIITVSSQIFRISATATINNISLTTTAIVQRDKPSTTASWRCNVLNWQHE